MFVQVLEEVVEEVIELLRESVKVHVIEILEEGPGTLEEVVDVLWHVEEILVETVGSLRMLSM